MYDRDDFDSIATDHRPVGERGAAAAAARVSAPCWPPASTTWPRA